LGARDALFVLAFALLIGEVITLVASITALVVGPRGVARSEAGHRSSSRLSFRAAAPFAANSVLNLAFNRFDVVLLAALTSADQLARYAPASRIQDAFYLIPVALSTIALPLVSREWHRSGTRAIRALVAQLIVLGLALALPAAIVVFVYAPEVISFVLGDDYSGAVRPTRILIWSLPFSAVTSVLLAALAGTNRATDTTRVFVVAFVVATAMHLSLDWWWGATGAAVASLSRDPAALCAAAIYARRAGLIGRTRSATAVRAVTSEPHQVSRDG
jgi:O-antigen/teichoic acid export membrane protein